MTPPRPAHPRPDAPARRGARGRRAADGQPPRTRVPGADQPRHRAPAARLSDRATTCLILTASGTGGLEAAVVNLLSPGDPVLAVSIGSFGDRFARYCPALRRRRHARSTSSGAGQPTRPRSPRRLRAMADDGPPGARRPPDPQRDLDRRGQPAAASCRGVRERARHAHPRRRHQRPRRACPFETDAWGLDVVVTGSQKSWMMPPGLAMVAVSDRAWAAAERRRCRASTSTCGRAAKSLAKGETPWTPAVGVLLRARRRARR